MYYLQSRYYDPNTGRFLNADAFASTGQGLLGNNMFAYCNNNPANYADPSGYMVGTPFQNRFSVTTGDILGMAAVGAILVGAGSTAISASSTLIEDTAQKIKEWVVAQAGLKKYRDNSVYILVDKDNGNLVRYVGRTNDPDRRMSEHRRDNPSRQGYDMLVVATGLTVDEARLVEQVFISAYTVLYLENARREIAVRNVDKFGNYMSAVMELNMGVTADEILELIKGR